jgi:hypothetical protein
MEVEGSMRLWLMKWWEMSETIWLASQMSSASLPDLPAQKQRRAGLGRFENEGYWG